MKEKKLCFIGVNNDSNAKIISSSMLNKIPSSVVEKKLLFPNERNFTIDVETKSLRPIKRSLFNSSGTNFEYESKVRASAAKDSGARRGGPVKNERGTRWKEGMSKD